MITAEDDDDTILSGLHSKNLHFNDADNGKSSTTKRIKMRNRKLIKNKKENL